MYRAAIAETVFQIFGARRWNCQLVQVVPEVKSINQLCFITTIHLYLDFTMFSVNICSTEESTENIDCLLYVNPLRINIIFDKDHFAAGGQIITSRIILE